jgi:hypothetical protein
MGQVTEESQLIPGKIKRFFSPPNDPDQFWGPHGLLLIGYW